MAMKTRDLSLILTALSVAAYFAVTCIRFGDGVKWWVMGFHLVMAAAGMISGLAALVMRQWWALISVGACGYLLKIQLIG